jgi:hypothetical protein
MNPKMTTGAAAGIAVQIVVVLMWLLAMAHITVPNDVAIALAGIITWAGGLVLHPNNSADAPPGNRMTPIVRSIIAALAVVGLAGPLALRALATSDEPTTVWQTIAAAPSIVDLIEPAFDPCNRSGQGAVELRRCLALSATTKGPQ